MLSPRGMTLHGMVQVWDLGGNDLKAFHSMQWSRLTNAPSGFPPGVTVERIECEGDYNLWVGVSNLVNRDCFVDYELMSKNDNTIIYVRRTSKDPGTLNIQHELSMINVKSPETWIVGASLERTTVQEGG
ncbi:hypothetical protein LOC67_22580 [Stieleria sp. JC731]|uniref:hypothetical protein n=1 Tax=Stieleria sp. JC731 TaxID=2894195 RepID=UPI001E5D1AD0|nr:hypothetical protein [Stieleria sp. JC731]MCC9603346.1 hypothetical protein [Stieleria sp. JC731]